MLSDLLPGSLQDWSPTTDGSLVSQSTCLHSPDCDYVLLLNGTENLRQLLVSVVDDASIVWNDIYAGFKKKPGFKKKAQPTGFYWAFLGFIRFY